MARIMTDITFDRLTFLMTPDDPVIKPRLPLEWDPFPVRVFGHHTFERTDDRSQVLLLILEFIPRHQSLQILFRFPENQQAMDMIGHHHKLAQMDKWKMFRDRFPALPGIPSDGRQFHDPLRGNIPEIIPFMRRTKGHEIDPVASVICRTQPCRFNPIFPFIFFHYIVETCDSHVSAARIARLYNHHFC